MKCQGSLGAPIRLYPYSRRLALLPTATIKFLLSNCPPSPIRAAAHMHGMGSCPESTHCQEATLHTTGPVGMHPTCPAGSVPHISYQQPSRMGRCHESTSIRRHGLWDNTSRGLESVLGAVHGVALWVAARWTGDSGATAQVMQYPLGATTCLLYNFPVKVLSFGGCLNLMRWNCLMQLPCTLLCVSICVR
eukprot:1161071-Pelagomonas_calceolata.AAC.10